MPNHQYSNPSVKFLIIGCWLGAAAFGLVTLAGWVFGETALSSISREWSPMSPSSAILFILFGIALTLMILYPGQKGARIYVWISVFTGTAVALLLFSLSIQEIHLNTEHLGFTVIETVGMSPVGHMSPVTAVCFILTGLTFFFLLFPFQQKTNSIVVSLILSLLLLILGLV
ncbi:hypothetical protein H8D57_02265, partial [bacterium]|nr:hypothetical protein [bacterium]